MAKIVDCGVFEFAPCTHGSIAMMFVVRQRLHIVFLGHLKDLEITRNLTRSLTKSWLPFLHQHLQIVKYPINRGGSLGQINGFLIPHQTTCLPFQ